jgi:hypothetical protein
VAVACGEEAGMSTLQDIIATLDRHGIEPISLTYEHLTSGTHWTLYVGCCADFWTLAGEWHGRRSDRLTGFHATERTRLAQCGDGLLGHLCHHLLPCWDSVEGEAPAEPEQGVPIGGAL